MENLSINHYCLLILKVLVMSLEQKQLLVYYFQFK